MAVYYNEIDPFAAAWLRELMKAGQIPDGEVDERSIELVRPEDLRGFGQCHFFAGIGGWAYALKLAGWPDEREVWTGSCPCQPFSSAGTQAGGHDPRDLWPAWRKLIVECRPECVFGEQVEAAIGHGWLDRVCDDLEREGYAIGACGLPAASIGAFHIRQRLWFVADANQERCEQHAKRNVAQIAGISDEASRGNNAGGRSQYGRMANGQSRGLAMRRSASGPSGYVTERVPVGDERCGCWDRNAFHRTVGMLPGEICVNKGALDNAEQQRTGRSAGREGRAESSTPSSGQDEGRGELQIINSGAVNWSAAEWIECADGKARPVEPGTFPLAYGVPARVGRLRGYGNAIVPQVAQVFIEAYLDTVEGEARC